MNEQLIQLLEAHYKQDEAAFRNAALRLAEQEARKGNSSTAREIRELIDRSTKIRYVPSKDKTSSVGNADKREETTGQDFMIAMNPKNKREDLIVSSTINEKIDQILLEYSKQDKLRKHGYENKRKLLLVGPPGTGKTMTASIIASQCNQPLYIIQTDKIINRYLGETGARLRQVFDEIKKQHGVYLFDEFDAIASSRMQDNDIGEMRRLVNSLLQFLEQEETTSIVIAATNNQEMLDTAMFRRFDDILYYTKPDRMEITLLIQQYMGVFMTRSEQATLPMSDFVGLSHAEIAKGCEDAIKSTILSEKSVVSRSLLMSCLQNRKSFHSSF